MATIGGWPLSEGGQYRRNPIVGHYRTVGTIRKLAHWRETGGGDRSCRETGGGDRLKAEIVGLDSWNWAWTVGVGRGNWVWKAGIGLGKLKLGVER